MSIFTKLNAILKIQFAGAALNHLSKSFNNVNDFPRLDSIVSSFASIFNMEIIQGITETYTFFPQEGGDYPPYLCGMTDLREISSDKRLFHSNPNRDRYEKLLIRFFQLISRGRQQLNAGQFLAIGTPLFLSVSAGTHTHNISYKSIIIILIIYGRLVIFCFFRGVGRLTVQAYYYYCQAQQEQYDYSRLNDNAREY